MLLYHKLGGSFSDYHGNPWAEFGLRVRALELLPGERGGPENRGIAIRHAGGRQLDIAGEDL